MIATIVIVLSIILIVIFAAYYLSSRTTNKQLHIGDPAPDLALIDETGNVHTLSELQGRKIALFFYPKDNTPGCTKEVCNIRDNFAQLKNIGITILGVSGGTPKDKQQFKKQNNLPFPLLTANENTVNAYGAQGGIFNLYMPKRETFLINEQGIIVNIITDVNVNDHAQQILDAFAQIEQPK
jgi:thioredoxin-dependent peroxiredoxin